MAWGAVVVGVFATLAWAIHFDRREEPRRRAVAALGEVERSLAGADAAAVLGKLRLPADVQQRTAAEQARWLEEALRDEISAPGLDALRRQGRFGPLAEIFPEEALRWTKAAAVPLGECVAFRLERGGVRAEVVLHQTPAGLRLLRCNNVAQMTPPPGS